jgi:rRNA-processing protein FCF1
MSQLVSDTSALVSLGIVADEEPDPLRLCLTQYTVVVPTAVIKELREIASCDDAHGRGASIVLNQAQAFEARSVDLDAEFPLDDGEKAAVSLANKLDAALFLCGEFNRLGLIHASLADTRLVTTPTLLSVLVRTDHLSAGDARLLLDEVSDARSWDANSYVQRSRSLLEEP